MLFAITEFRDLSLNAAGEASVLDFFIENQHQWKKCFSFIGADLCMPVFPDLDQRLSCHGLRLRDSHELEDGRCYIRELSVLHVVYSCVDDDELHRVE